jgi:hypothetical protein
MKSLYEGVTGTHGSLAFGLIVSRPSTFNQKFVNARRFASSANRCLTGSLRTYRLFPAVAFG